MKLARTNTQTHTHDADAMVRPVLPELLAHTRPPPFWAPNHTYISCRAFGALATIAHTVPFAFVGFARAHTFGSTRPRDTGAQVLRT